MAMKGLDTIQPFMVPYLPGAPLGILMQKAHAGMRELLRRAPLWTDDITVDAVEEQTEYTLDLSSVAADVSFTSILSLKDSDDNEAQKSDYYHDGRKLYLDQAIAPQEDETDAFTVQLQIVPLIGCSTYPDYIVDKFAEGVAAYALSSCAAMSQRPWSDPIVAQESKREWRRTLQQALIEQDESPNSIKG